MGPTSRSFSGAAAPFPLQPWVVGALRSLKIVLLEPIPSGGKSWRVQLEPDSAALRTLRRLVIVRREIVDDRVPLTNRITSGLEQYFRQILGWVRGSSTIDSEDRRLIGPPARCLQCRGNPERQPGLPTLPPRALHKFPTTKGC
jgi:hypothetical protein